MTHNKTNPTVPSTYTPARVRTHDHQNDDVAIGKEVGSNWIAG